MLKRRGLPSPGTQTPPTTKPEGPPRGGWVYGSFNGNADENMRTLQRKHLARTSSFGTVGVRRSSSSSKDILSPPTQLQAGGKFSMLEFSMMYFRQNIDRYEALKSSSSRDLHDSIKKMETLKLSTIKKKMMRKNSEEKLKTESWTWKEQADAIKWTDVPLENSLLKLPTAEMSSDAVECFQAIMMYMGDMQLDEDCSEVDCVFRIMKACHQQPELRDECYCQLAKQTTNNKSSNQLSCLKGWRLLTLLSCWFACSDILKPFLLNYLQQNASDPSRAHYSIASTCLSSIRKTFKFGGRRNVPTAEEINAFSAGKFSRRQLIQLPGAEGIVVNITPYTLVRETVEDICTKLGIISQNEMDEYCLFALYGSSHTVRLKREEYIMDVISQMRLHQVNCALHFERLCWYHPVHFDLVSDQYIEMVYSQVIDKYMDGALVCVPEKIKRIPARLLEDIIKLAGLTWRIACNDDNKLTEETCVDFVPDIVTLLGMVTPDQLLNGMATFLKALDIDSCNILDLKIEVIDILKKWPMFGASVYKIKCDSDPRIAGACLFAVNRAGIHFLECKSHKVMLSYPFTEVISTRKIVNDFSEHLDVKVGNIQIQKVLRLDTDDTCDIIYTIGQYIKILNNNAKHS